MIIIEDWFYDNPEEVYEYALKQEYLTCEDITKVTNKDALYSGVRSTIQYITQEALDNFSRYFGFRVYPYGDMCGRFQVCTSDDRIWPHIDNDPYAAVVFLDRKQPVEGGTSFYRNKIDNTITFNSDPESELPLSQQWAARLDEMKMVAGDTTKWEEVARVGLLFNRMVAYPGNYYHDATNYYGSSFEDGRLFQVFFLTPDKNQASNVEIIK